MPITASNNKRFGALPLPVEMDNQAAEGEIMVGRTTGHIYVRSGGVNKSKTVELENWINTYRPNALNWIRNSGGDTLEEELALQDWVLSTQNPVQNGVTIETEPDKNFKFIRTRFFTPAQAGNWSVLANKMYTYFNFKALNVGMKICLSVTMRTNNSSKIYFSVRHMNSENNILPFPSIQTNGEFKRYEIVTTLKDGANEPVLYITTDGDNTILDIKDIQIEPGDRASAHRVSIFDAMQRMEWLDEKNKGDLEEKIQQAINECKNYTNSEITKLDNKIQTAINNAITECKNYTNTKHNEINKRVDNEIAEIHKSLRNERAHIILGNSDWSSYCKKTEGEIIYSSENKGVVVKKGAKFTIDKPISINEDSKYYVRVTVQSLKGSGYIYCGVQSLDNNLNPVETDACNTHNYGLAGVETPDGQVKTFSTIFQGYNKPVSESQSASVNKFDPYANFFRVVIYANYDSTSKDTSETLIKSVEVFEIPGCLEDAISPVSDSKNGLMTIPQKQKLDGIEDRANRYVHPDNDGSRHVPATGTTNNGKVLTAGSQPGEFAWKDLPTDSGTLEGKHASDFVWINEKIKSVQSASNAANQDMHTKYLQRNNALYTQAINWNMGYTGNVGFMYIKTPVKYNQYFTLNFSLYEYNLGVANISIGGYYIENQSVYYVYSDNAAMTSYNVSILTDSSGRMIIKLGQSTSIWRWAYISIDSLTLGWLSPGMDNYLRTSWEISFNNTDSGKTVIKNNIRINSNLDASTLDGLDSSYFARNIGDAVTTYTSIPSARSANLNLRSNNQDSWIIYDNSSPLQNPFGLYFRNTDSPLAISGQKTLPQNSFAFIGGGVLMHYMTLSNGDVFHKGKLESSNIQLGEFRIIKNVEEKCLDFIFE